MNTMKPFFFAFLLLAATMATLTPAVRADDNDGDGDDTNIDIEGGFWWYIRYGRSGNKCPNTVWGRRVCLNKVRDRTCCNHHCVDINSHKYNCGSCGSVCPFPTQCCGGKCVKLLSDRENCGKCGNKCLHKAGCNRGVCGYAE